MRVLAIQYGNHDCSACIYDGEIKNYFLEKKDTAVRNTTSTTLRSTRTFFA